MLNEPVRKTLLIIEDNVEILDILELIFQTEGYNVFASLNGNEVSDIEAIAPDLILLDIRLSKHGTEGADICLLLKSQDITHHIPIILLSAELDIVDICRNCGANDYIRKPFDIDDLCSKVKNFAHA